MPIQITVKKQCDSASDEVKIGEGVMLYRRSGDGAGQSLESERQATSQLMTEFMGRWRGGEPRVKAWREAQLSLLRSKGAAPDFSNPCFWAAFTLTGQWR